MCARAGRVRSLGVLLAAAPGVVLAGAPAPAAIPWSDFASTQVQSLAPPRVLLKPDVAGALKVMNVPFPNQVLDGLYFPTSQDLHGGIAYKKEDFGTGKPSELWLARDPNGYWCIQPTAYKGSGDALMITSHPHRDHPENAEGWQLWEEKDGNDAKWQVDPSIKVILCENHICDADISFGGGGRMTRVGDCEEPRPVPLDRSFDNSPGESLLTPLYLMTNCSDTYSYKLWALLVLGGLLLILVLVCLASSENRAARSYIYNTGSFAISLLVGILVASQLVPLITFGNWRSSWSIELLCFIVGFVMIHWITWKCQFSPLRRTMGWTFGGCLVGAFGVAAFVDLREALFGWGWADDVLLAIMLCIGVGALLGVLHFIMKKVSARSFANPSPTSWPPEPMTSTPADTSGKSRSCVTRACWPSEIVAKVEEALYYDWQIDALWAEYTAISVVLAFAIYNVLRTISNCFGEEYLVWTWIVILVLMLILICAVHKVIKKKMEKDGNQDWHADLLIVGTLSRVLGLCVVGAMRKVNPGLKENLVDWFGISAIFGSVLEVLVLTFGVFLLILILSHVYRNEDFTYGALDFNPECPYPEEVVGMATAMSVVWAVFFSGLLGDFVRSNDWLYWIVPDFLRNTEKNHVWFHALFCMVLAHILYIFWKRYIFRRMAMYLDSHTKMVASEKEVFDQMKHVQPTF